jgi:transcriptional regulator with XRE-family HTH domain
VLIWHDLARGKLSCQAARDVTSTTVVPIRLYRTEMADSERDAVRRRRGYWISLARRRKGMTLDALAAHVGYGEASGSVISRWESGDRAVPSDRFGRLANVLDLPADYLVNPPLTDSERLDELARVAVAEEREDWERAQTTLPDAEDGHDGQRQRRPA